MPKTPIDFADSPHLRFHHGATRGWVKIGTAIAAVSYAVMGAVNVASWGWRPEHHPGSLFAVALVSAAGWVVASRGNALAGGLMALGACWCELQYSLFVADRFPVPSLVAGPAVLVAAALLLRAPMSLAITIATILTTWLAVLVSPVVAASGFTTVTGYWLTMHTVVMLAAWALVALGFSIADRAFDALVLKERELSETIDRAPDGILVIDAKDEVRVANPAAERLLGMAGSACVGRRISDVLHEASHGTATASLAGGTATHVAQVLHDTGERPRAWSLSRPDGHVAELELTWRAMDGGRRQLVLRDVSERTRAENVRRDMEVQLAHAQRLEAVGQLAGGIAHDFNNILTIVGASAEVLRAEMQDTVNAPLLDEILAAQERGAALTRQLLAFARRDVVQPRVFDLSALVLTLRSLLQRVAGEQVRLAFDVEPDCRIHADVAQVEQAFVNLVSNARDAMPDGGTCAIRAGRMTNDDGAPWVRIRVSDTGRGMDAATSTRAFEPFFTTKPRGRGTGLGLSAVHGMVLQSHGRADIESRVGRGTTVVLEFPFAQAPLSTPVSAVPAVAEGGGATILVAEDDDGTRATVARMLGRLGYTVVLAPDGQQALRMLTTTAATVDLLLTDVMMPGLTGPALVTRMREHGLPLPVLFMSGYPEESLESVPGFNLDTDFLAKPFSSAQLARCIAQKLGTAVAAVSDD